MTSTAFGNVTAYFNQNPRTSYVDPYRNVNRYGDNLEEVIIREINSAKKSIYIAVQEMRLPLIAKALAERKKAGVDVRVVLENNYHFTILTQKDPTGDNEHEASRLMDLNAFIDVNRNGKIELEELENRDAVYMLDKASIPVMDDSYDGSRGSGLMHHKFMIVDNKTTIVSTANFTMSCIHGDILAPTSRGNANSMVRVDSPNFARIFLAEFAQLWGNGTRGNYGQNKTYRGPQTTSVNGTELTVQFSPTSQRHNWEDSVNGLIAAHMNTARQSIKALLFVFSDQNLANVMESRQNAGAQIGVMIEPNFAYRNYSELFDLMGVRMPTADCKVEAGNNPWKVPAREVGMAMPARGDMLHHKFAVVDRRTVIVGSQNWSDAANYINDETLLVIQNPMIAEQFTQEYERVKRTAVIGLPPRVKAQIQSLETRCADQGRYL